MKPPQLKDDHMIMYCLLRPVDECGAMPLHLGLNPGLRGEKLTAMKTVVQIHLTYRLESIL
jgi:hypothetical protein